MHRIAGAALLTAITAGSAFAGCKVDVSDYVGWQIIYAGTVTGYVDDNGVSKTDLQECERGRVLIVDYTSTVTCDEYSYAYAYLPDIVVLSNGRSTEACIDDKMFDIRTR